MLGLENMFDITLLAAFLAGLLSFLSPCILPIVPFYLSYLTGIGIQKINTNLEMKRVTMIKTVASACFFAMGVTTVFVALGASASYVGLVFRDYFDILKYIAAAVIILMGLNFLGILKISLLFRQFQFVRNQTNSISVLGAYFVGLTFAFGWTPCVGPILSVILFLAAGQDTATQGIYLLMAYGLGMTLPFIITAIFINYFIKWLKKFRPYLWLIEKITGWALVLFGLFIATDTVNLIANWMSVVLPWFNLIG